MRSYFMVGRISHRTSDDLHNIDYLASTVLDIVSVFLKASLHSGVNDITLCEFKTRTDCGVIFAVQPRKSTKNLRHWRDQLAAVLPLCEIIHLDNDNATNLNSRKPLTAAATGKLQKKVRESLNFSPTETLVLYKIFKRLPVRRRAVLEGDSLLSAEIIALLLHLAFCFPHVNYTTVMPSSLRLIPSKFSPILNYKATGGAPPTSLLHVSGSAGRLSLELLVSPPDTYEKGIPLTSLVLNGEPKVEWSDDLIKPVALIWSLLHHEVHGYSYGPQGSLRLPYTVITSISCPPDILTSTKRSVLISSDTLAFQALQHSAVCIALAGHCEACRFFLETHGHAMAGLTSAATSRTLKARLRPAPIPVHRSPSRHVYVEVERGAFGREVKALRAKRCPQEPRVIDAIHSAELRLETFGFWFGESHSQEAYRQLDVFPAPVNRAVPLPGCREFRIPTIIFNTTPLFIYQVFDSFLILETPAVRDVLLIIDQHALAERINVTRCYSNLELIFPGMSADDMETVTLVNSISCRNAIKAGDILSNDDTIKLFNRAFFSYFPFQCAHGRPSVLPITIPEG